MSKKSVFFHFFYSSKLVDMQKLVDSLKGLPRNHLFLVDLCFDKLSGAHSTQNLVEIQNT